jgi:hypothetical protein
MSMNLEEGWERKSTGREEARLFRGKEWLAYSSTRNNSRKKLEGVGFFSTCGCGGTIRLAIQL